MAVDIAGIGGAASGIFMTIMKAIVVIGVAAGAFFGSRSFMRAKREREAYKLTAVVTNPDGSHYTCKVGKFKGKDGLQKMLFLNKKKGLLGTKYWGKMKGETMPVINPKHIVNLSIHLYRYGPSQYAILPPTIYRDIDLKKFKINLINMHMLEFKGLEQRASISRWNDQKNNIMKVIPFATILFCLILAGVSIYFIYKFGSTNYASNIASRTADCVSLIGSGSSPIPVG